MTPPPPSLSSGADDLAYHALVIDSGAIIKQDTSATLPPASLYYTTPSVLAEIRDAKSRSHLESFRLRLKSLRDAELVARTPSTEGLAAVSSFARRTGDYNQLSSTDLGVLALLYDAEGEAAAAHNGGNMDHIRREPKRVLGARVTPLSGDGRRTVVARRDRGDSIAGSSAAGSSVTEVGAASFLAGGAIDASCVDVEYDDGGEAAAGDAEATEEGGGSKPVNTTWARLVNPERAPSGPALDYALLPPVNVPGKTKEEETETPVTLEEVKAEVVPAQVGQFDDASDDDAECGDDESDGELAAIDIANADSDGEDMSDEECDCFVLEPHEAAYFKRLREKQEGNSADVSQEEKVEDDGGLDSDFPSLSAAVAVPYEGSDDEEESEELEELGPDAQAAWLQEEEERKRKSLQPMINGRVATGAAPYSSFRKYKGVVSTAGSAEAARRRAERAASEEEKAALLEEEDDAAEAEAEGEGDSPAASGQYKSRILPAAASSVNHQSMTEDDDDGEGWVTCARDIRAMKASGSISLRPSNDSGGNFTNQRPRKDNCPPPEHRAACATTDFAMQNVILQMNLELVSVDGVRIRRLKTWVTRCNACFAVYGANDDANKGRLFCDKCGSDSLGRVAASVDRNSGRLKLHLKRNYQHNTRGTKFALPKAGKVRFFLCFHCSEQHQLPAAGVDLLVPSNDHTSKQANKYEGDLLLTEDQLMYGAWNQKVRKGRPKSANQSIFGSDLASDLGCVSDLTRRDDIRVGFGRRNPNAARGGRERRGKKKKDKNKACGLRRY